MTGYKAQLRFRDRDLSIEVGADETILEAARRQGVFPLADCTLGVCGTCKALRVEGESDTGGIDTQGLTLLEANKGYILTCQSYARSDLSLEFGYEAARALRPATRELTATLVESVPVAESVVRLRLDTGEESFDFRPGQYVNITVPGSSERRSYSFANPPGSGSESELFIRILPDGLMSRYLEERARPGDRLEVTGPFGEFYLREPTRPILMVAGGTGLAPMLSMLGELEASGREAPAVHLLYGVNRSSEIFGTERLDAYRGALGGLDYEVTVAYPDAGWSGPTGFVTELLRAELVPATGLDAYVCGPPPMIEAVTAWLADHGLSVEHIHSEKFSPSGVPPRT